MKNIKAARVLRTIAEAGFEGDACQAAWALIGALATGFDNEARARNDLDRGLSLDIREMSQAEAARKVADRLDPPAPRLTSSLFGGG